MDLNHLNLRVRDAAACRDFYQDHFGFRPAFEGGGGFFVRNDDGFLLSLAPAEDHRPLPEGFHVGFGLADASAVRAMHATLAAAGVQVTAVGDAEPGETYVTFRCWGPDAPRSRSSGRSPDAPRAAGHGSTTTR